MTIQLTQEQAQKALAELIASEQKAQAGRKVHSLRTLQRRAKRMEQRGNKFSVAHWHGQCEVSRVAEALRIAEAANRRGVANGDKVRLLRRELVKAQSNLLNATRRHYRAERHQQLLADALRLAKEVQVHHRYGWITDVETNEQVRPATPQEWFDGVTPLGRADSFLDRSGALVYVQGWDADLLNVRDLLISEEVQ